MLYELGVQRKTVPLSDKMFLYEGVFELNRLCRQGLRSPKSLATEDAVAWVGYIKAQDSVFEHLGFSCLMV